MRRPWAEARAAAAAVARLALICRHGRGRRWHACRRRVAAARATGRRWAASPAAAGAACPRSTANRAAAARVTVCRRGEAGGSPQRFRWGRMPVLAVVAAVAAAVAVAVAARRRRRLGLVAVAEEGGVEVLAVEVLEAVAADGRVVERLGGLRLGGGLRLHPGPRRLPPIADRRRRRRRRAGVGAQGHRRRLHRQVWLARALSAAAPRRRRRRLRRRHPSEISSEIACRPRRRHLATRRRPASEARRPAGATSVAALSTSGLRWAYRWARWDGRAAAAAPTPPLAPTLPLAPTPPLAGARVVAAPSRA
jgi:hypothetical protein